jgi:coenzyme F420-reducing hydrogenase gamma subunit/ferredoxin/aerobic-type carbon monoxide dehydrogenase small subunit (CoxS/CutS family)
MDRTIQINIDGKEVNAYEGQLLVDVAHQNGVYIPTLCYFHNIYPPAASCRVCTVKINGRYEAGCTAKVFNAMQVEVNTDEIRDLRKANIEMLFAEGNHFCPACTKSGNCELQRKGYENGIIISRYPHLFKSRPRDYKSSRIIIDHDRCIHCKRCVERVRTADKKGVFAFIHRGHETIVAIDYENEKTLSHDEVLGAMELCPVGAILVRGESNSKPFGLRKYDLDKEHIGLPANGNGKKLAVNGDKKIIATTSLAGCFGCHMSLLDMDLEIIDLFNLVEFNKSPLTDIKKFTKNCDIGIIEGGVANTENYEVLMEFRKKCKVLVAMGECATWGGIPAIRNALPIEECLKEAYFDSATSVKGQKIIPYHEDIPKILDRVYAPNEIVKIDYFIPGCPPDAKHIVKVIKNIITGDEVPIEYPEFKYD